MLYKFLFFIPIIEFSFSAILSSANNQLFQNEKLENNLTEKYRKINIKNEDYCRCTGPLPKARIVNGTAVVGFDYEWVVAIFSKTLNEIVCTGSLLSKSTVLTAAHCQEDEKEELVVLAGFKGDWSKIKESEWGYRKVVKFIKNPNYNQNIELAKNPYDIAILELDRPFELGFNNSIYLACILNKEIKSLSSFDYWFAGFGITEPYILIQDNYDFSPYIQTKGLNHVKFKYNLEKCQKSDIIENFICLSNKDASLCNVDSGGGTYIFVGEKLALVSIMVSGEIKEYFNIIKSFCSQNSFAATLKVFNHLDFIKNVGKAQCFIDNFNG